MNIMSKSHAVLLFLSVVALNTEAQAHVGVVNTQLPYAVAGKSYELVLTVPHGCADPLDSTKELDTYKVEIITPAAFTAVRPIIDGVFGKPTRVSLDNGVTTTFVWTKAAALDSANDDQSYRIGLRGTVAATSEFTKLTFNTKQYCKNKAGSDDIVRDWTNYAAADGTISNQSPTVKVYPPRTLGWNKFNLASTNEKHTQADVKVFLTDFFADAQIVWVGKGAYSANVDTTTKIKTLASQDSAYSELIANASIMLHAGDDIWVKY